MGYIFTLLLFRTFYEADGSLNSLFIALMESGRKEEVEHVKIALREKVHGAQKETKHSSHHFQDNSVN